MSLKTSKTPTKPKIKWKGKKKITIKKNNNNNKHAKRENKVRVSYRGGKWAQHSFGSTHHQAQAAVVSAPPPIARPRFPPTATFPTPTTT